jgi:ribonuclease-3
MPSSSFGATASKQRWLDMAGKDAEWNRWAQANLGHTFNNPSLLRLALTHTSFANETHDETYGDNERLELLGDAVLSLIITEELYQRLEDAPEGHLARLRSAIVCEPSLACAARRLGLGQVLLLGKGEAKSGGRHRSSTLCDAFEAVVGALYLDGGLDVARKFVLTSVAKEIGRVVAGDALVDPKTQLQELVQAKQQATPMYRLVKTEGPDHNKTFTVEVYWQDQVWGTGRGRSKKAAEQAAAKEALDRIAFTNA